MPQREKITDEISIPKELSEELREDVVGLPDLSNKIEDNLNEEVSYLLNLIMSGGVVLGSSDIHIEPSEEDAKIRMRMDGVLHDLLTIDRDTYEDLVDRIKLLSGVKINVTKEPQDGRFTIAYPEEKEEYSIEIRMSSLPSEHGETIVMRLLDPRKLITIGKLGLRDELLKTFKEQVNKPTGMIIVTGPTGSGKTTTLYAFLRHLRSPEIKIVTIEDPIEYHLDDISQTEVNPDKGYDFANGLRSIVRQDPDVILVGEIRDLETASIGLQAALTGHKVFSTLHTNDAAGSIPRLQAIGEEAVNIAPALNMIIAQRLVRQLCPRCKERKEVENIEDQKKEKIKKILEDTPRDIKSLEEKERIYTADGCKECNFTGYRGRTGIFEAIIVDEELEQLIFSQPSTTEIRQKAKEMGMISMKQDGLLKVLQGETTLSEVQRVTGL